MRKPFSGRPFVIEDGPNCASRSSCTSPGATSRSNGTYSAWQDALESLL